MRRPQLLLLIAGIALLGVIYTTTFLNPSGLSGNLGTTLTINYENGDSREIDPTSNKFALVFGQLTVTDSSNNPISDICWSTYAKLTWSGDSTSNEVTGTIKIVDKSGTTRKTHTFTKTGLTSGTKKLLMAGTIAASTLEQWASGDSGSVTVKVTSTATITASDGTEKSKSATGQSSFSYLVSSPSPTLSITGFTVTAAVTTYSDPGPW